MNLRIVVINNHATSVLGFRWPIISGLKNQRCKVIVFAPRDGKVVIALAKEQVNYHSIPIARAGLNPFRDVFLFFKLYFSLKKIKPDKILCYTAKPVIYGSIAAYFAGVKQCFSVITGLGYVFIGDSLQKRILRKVVIFLYRFALKFNHKVFFQNKDDLALFLNYKMIDQNKTIRIGGSGVDLDYFKKELLPQQCSFLLLARLLKEKGVIEYFMAAERIKQKYPDVNCKLAGEFDSNPAALSKKELNYWLQRSQVEYLGYLTDVRPAIANASVYVLPSYREGTPRSVLEAMAMGRPVITTDTPGCRDTVEDGINGYLIPVENVDKLYWAMEQFILRPELISKMGKESRRIAEEEYDVNKVNNVILQTMGIS